MANAKDDVLEMFRELSELTILEEGDPASFRVRAYESAARAVEAHPGDIAALTLAQLQGLDGVGKSSAGKIREQIDTGKVGKLEELRKKHPASVVALLSIPGLGPKAVNRLRKELSVMGLEDLKQAVATHKVRELKGFGQKTEDKLAATLERMAKQGSVGRTPISVALPLAHRVVATLRDLPGVTHAQYCGSLRRFSETIGDLDIVVTAADAGPVMDAVVALPMVEQVLGRGDTKTSVVTRRGLQIDVRVVAEHQLGAALAYFTGSKAHNVKLRGRAIARGMTLNEYALTETATKRVVAERTEEDIYAALGLPFIPPHLREDVGEIELAEQGLLPRRIALGEIRGDFHVHTTVSGDGRSTLEETVATARARGVRVLAITDHAEGTVSGVGRDALMAQRERIQALAKELGGAMVLLHGVELNIGPNGELDYDEEFRRGFDFTLASIHDHFDLGRDAQTARVIKAMQDPAVRMIGHLTARMIGARPGVDLDLAAIFAAAEETGTALEINGGLPRLDMPVDAVRQARERDITFVLTSDAHHESELARVEHAAKVAEKAWLPLEKIANLWEPARLERWARGAA